MPDTYIAVFLPDIHKKEAIMTHKEKVLKDYMDYVESERWKLRVLAIVGVGLPLALGFSVFLTSAALFILS